MRKTVKEHFSFSGPGIHTGVNASLTVVPSFGARGIFFSYQGVEDGKQRFIPCHVSNVVSTQRCTVLGNGEKTVYTVEHLLATLHANGVTDAELRIEGPEVPALDGSGKAFQQMIEKAGIEEYRGDDWDVLVIEDPMDFECSQSGAVYRATPAEGYELEVVLKYDNAVLGDMQAEWTFGDGFGEQIAPARTFSLFSEISGMLQSGLIQGGNFKNAVVIQDDDIPADQIKSEINKYISGGSDVSVKNQVINGPLFFPNEPARHKILDMLGDLSLLNLRIRGRVSAIRPGHTGNYNFARYLINAFYG